MVKKLSSFFGTIALNMAVDSGHSYNTVHSKGGGVDDVSHTYFLKNCFHGFWSEKFCFDSKNMLLEIISFSIILQFKANLA